SGGGWNGPRGNERRPGEADALRRQVRSSAGLERRRRARRGRVLRAEAPRRDAEDGQDRRRGQPEGRRGASVRRVHARLSGLRTEEGLTRMGDPIPYAPGGVKISIGVPAVVALPARTYRVRLVGLLYENDKTFLLPPAMHSIRTLKRFYDSHPGLQLLVHGHADRQGSADYNRSLSA